MAPYLILLNEHEIAVREAKRVAPMVDLENVRKQQLLAQKPFTGKNHLSKNGKTGSSGQSGSNGQNGASGRVTVNFNGLPGMRNVNGRNGSGGNGERGSDGRDGSRGKDGGQVHVIIVEAVTQYTAPFGRIIIEDHNGKKLSEGYWDFTSTLNIDVSAGNGGTGGRGGRGGNGGVGASGSYRSGRYPTAGGGGSGGDGGDGGDGGNGGRGGNGGSVKVLFVGSNNFATKVKPLIKVHKQGGTGGSEGGRGRSGSSGKPGIHASGGKARYGGDGYRGGYGDPGSDGRQGHVSYKRLTLSDYQAHIQKQEAKAAQVKHMAVTKSPAPAQGSTSAPDPKRDTDAQPLVRIPPNMPPRAQRSGHCILNFDVTESGTTTNITMTSCTDILFFDAAKASVALWRYQPAQLNGRAVYRRSVKSQVTFMLTDERGNIIPE